MSVATLLSRQEKNFITWFSDEKKISRKALPILEQFLNILSDI